MINSKGIIQNNQGTTELLKYLKSSKKQYKTLKKEEERAIIDEYVEIMKYEDGTDVLDTTDPLYVEWALEKDESKRRELYGMVRRVIVWKKDQKEFCDLMVMHNIRFVFSISKKYCKSTRDYDNMIEKGLYGLVRAANMFYPFKVMTKKDENGNKIITRDESGNTEYIKFCTYAQKWIFKYTVEEFQDKTITEIDNYSTSINENVKMNNSDSKTTMENYIDSVVSPEYSLPKTVTEEISSNEYSGFYESIHKYLESTNELTALEKQIVIDTYYNGLKPREIAKKMSYDTSIITTNKMKALKKLKNYMVTTYNINSIDDI